MSFTTTAINTTGVNAFPQAYAEVLINVAANVDDLMYVGLLPVPGGNIAVDGGALCLRQDGILFLSGGQAAVGEGWSAGDTVCIAYDQSTESVWFRINERAWMGGGDPATGSNPTAIGAAGVLYVSVAERSSNNAGQVTGRFQNSEFQFPVPNGYSSWSGE